MSITYLISIMFDVYNILIFVRIILSFIPHNPYQPAVRFIYEITEPVLGLFRRVIPPIGMIDISPIFAIIALQLAEHLILKLLYMIGM